MLAATLSAVLLAATATTIDVRDSGHIVRVGDFKPKQYLGSKHFSGGVTPTRGNAIKAYGKPDKRDENGCANVWRKLGVRLITADFSGGAPCTNSTPVQKIEITSAKWETERGLKIGDSLDRVRELYPDVERWSELYDEDNPATRYDWALVTEKSDVGGPPNKIDRLTAEIRKRKVVLLRVAPYGAGD